MEQKRLNHLVNKYGLIEAKKKMVEYCHVYFEYAIHNLHKGKMGIYYPKMRQSIDEFLDFLEK